MPDSSSDLSPSTIQSQPWAVRIGGALLVAMALIIGLAFFDYGRRQQLETVTETTAVGDTQFFQPPDPAKLPEIAATLNGKPLYVTQTKPIDLRDTHMRRVGRDAERGVTIYELSDAATDVERGRVGHKPRALLLKIGANEYVSAQAAGEK